MRTVRVTLSPPGGTFHPVDRSIVESDALVRESIPALDRLADGSVIALYNLYAPSPASISNVVEPVETVRSFDVATGQDGMYTVFLHLEPEDPMAALLAVADENALLVDQPLLFVDDGLVLRAVGHDDSLQSAIAALPADVDMTIDSTVEDPPGRGTLRAELTDRQREAMEAAIELGYYESPRAATCEDIADVLDCAPTTANALLRRAEGTLATSLLGN